MKLSGILLAAPLALAAPILEGRGETIPGRWIVVMNEDSSHESMASSMADIAGDLTPKHTYNMGMFKGYTMEASEDLISSIANLAEVAYVEADVKVSIASLQTQAQAPWGLARISSHVAGTTEYIYDESAGADTYAYIIDTGIYLAHPEFEGRASFGASFVEGDDTDTDGNGHGTHVAGTTGSATYGVAKKTNLIAVKVLDADGSGALSQVIAGIQWAVDDATSKGRIAKSVANMSLGALSLGTSTVNTAAKAAVAAGLFIAAAAGNNDLPAVIFSPASEATVCTVGATASNDTRAYFSNYGTAIDVWAPGVGVLSTYKNGSTAVLSGTSMSTPHVTGLAAYLLALEGERDPVALCQRIQELGTQDAVGDSESDNSMIVYNGNA
ncbi:Uu.00g009770.m01.CDS01 [Anthostomella pinea]|uniref:Uu.00g009770.m01.CDS01 n=1 Tax=Anthostomella pinea TaxID=933095 RepID=A0AAI8YPY6_9PEZI|nr:Uu.00g009770.m01.CDS01 [Anthostomella pinea]